MQYKRIVEIDLGQYKILRDDLGALVGHKCTPTDEAYTWSSVLTKCWACKTPYPSGIAVAAQLIENAHDRKRKNR